MTERLFSLLPPIDVGDPKAFITATVAIFASYPVEVMQGALHPVNGIPGRTDRPTLKIIKDTCDEIYTPILRVIEYEDRQRARDRMAKHLLPPPKRTPEQQARIDAMVAETRVALGIENGAPRREVVLPPSADLPMNAPVPVTRNDGRHGERIAADLAARKQRREAGGTDGGGMD